MVGLTKKINCSNVIVRWQLNMLCVNSRGNWDNGSNAGSRNRNLNNSRSNANNNVGFADSMLCGLMQRLLTGKEGAAVEACAEIFSESPLVGANTKSCPSPNVGWRLL